MMPLNLLGGGSSRGSGPKNRVEFRAGKMSLSGNLVSPDKRKGLVYIYNSDDGLTHFCWKDRKTGNVEDDLIVFPDDCEFKKVTQCKEGSRVFVLKFKVSARKLFFWMQEPKTDVDEDLAWRVNEALNNPHAPPPSSSSSSSSRPPLPEVSSAQLLAEGEAMQNVIGRMSQSQLVQLLGGVGTMRDLDGQGLLTQLSQIAPSLANEMRVNLGMPIPPPVSAGGGSESGGGGTTTTSANSASTPKSTPAPKLKKPTPLTGSPTTTTTGANNSTTSGSTSSTPGPIQLTDLQSILNRIQSTPPPVDVDLSTVVNTETIRRITSCSKTVKKLVPLLPQFGHEGEENKEMGEKEVEKTLGSPQFQTALSSFCAAFKSGQLGPLISQFGMGTEAVKAAQTGNLEEFITAIQKETDSEKSTPTDIVEDMNID